MAKEGFSLIELIIVLIIISILMLMAVPTYEQYNIKTKRVDGKIALLDLAGKLAQYYVDNHTFATATIGQHKTTDVLNSTQSAEGYYQLCIIEQTNTSFIIQAIPLANKLQDEKCQKLQLNQLGEKTVTGQGTIKECW